MVGESTVTRRTAVRSLLDTNILVYADAGDEPEKQRCAIRVIKDLRASGDAILCTQVLQEYVNVALRKLRLPSALILERIAFYRRFEMVPTSPELIKNAVDLHLARGVAFYDALIVQAAVTGGCRRLLSEDFQHGAQWAGVVIENPLARQ